jgi:hypothetical protein
MNLQPLLLLLHPPDRQRCAEQITTDVQFSRLLLRRLPTLIDFHRIVFSAVKRGEGPTRDDDARCVCDDG